MYKFLGFFAFLGKLLLNFFPICSVRVQGILSYIVQW